MDGQFNKYIIIVIITDITTNNINSSNKIIVGLVVVVVGVVVVGVEVVAFLDWVGTYQARNLPTVLSSVVEGKGKYICQYVNESARTMP